MEVQLSEKARETIESLVRDGGYASAEQAVEAAVDLLAAKQKADLEHLKELVEEGRRDIEEGRYTVLTEESVAALKARIDAEGRARLAELRRA